MVPLHSKSCQCKQQLVNVNMLQMSFMSKAEELDTINWQASDRELVVLEY